MTVNDLKGTGLTSEQAEQRIQQYGKNVLAVQKKEGFLEKVFHIICEPMFLLLLVAAVIYFILGEPRDGAIMLVFVVGIISIDVIQEWKTDKTLNALKNLSAPHITVIRDGREQEIASENLVPGDLMMIHEGVKIPADGKVMKCADLCVDESSLTGEAEGVWKTVFKSDTYSKQKEYWRNDYCYAGTLVIQGTGAILVDQTGVRTEYGKIGVNVAEAPQENTPLQKQTRKLVKTCTVIAGILFILVCIFTWLDLPDHSFGDRIIESILSGVTLAMAMIPEEFPVILTVFLSMGAWRLAKKNSLVRKLPSVETLGEVSVLCVDKTGTITMNQMSIQDTWLASGTEQELYETMGMACETDAYDPMEKAMLRFCNEHGLSKENLFNHPFISEYAFTNELKMMGHVWKKDNGILIAAKGSPEKLLSICDLNAEEKKRAEDQIVTLSQQGLRVIAVAKENLQNEQEIPAVITDCHLKLLGIVGLADPPRENVKNDIEVCRKAGIRVVMITGDNGITASAIAAKIGMDSSQIITGEMIEQMSEEELCKAVRKVSIFSRVIPEHKMRIVKAFKGNGEIVAMTGDGVNDAPALKYADIGIAMGKRGSEVSREAADLILMDDNFTTIVETIKDGRRIYDNIRKAVGYVFTIHIPIAFSSLLAPFLGIAPAAFMLLPLHIVLLEVMIDPTCSIVLERQPAETNIMERAPRDPKEEMLNTSLLWKSILQGVVVFAASFGTYLFMLSNGSENAPTARAMGLTIIMVANLFLVQVNSSNQDFAYQSFGRLLSDWVMWAVNLSTIAVLGIILYTPFAAVLKLAPLSVIQMFFSITIAAVSVLWYEVVKVYKYQKMKKKR